MLLINTEGSKWKMDNWLTLGISIDSLVSPIHSSPHPQKNQELPIKWSQALLNMLYRRSDRMEIGGWSFQSQLTALFNPQLPLTKDADVTTIGSFGV